MIVHSVSILFLYSIAIMLRNLVFLNIRCNVNQIVKFLWDIRQKSYIYLPIKIILVIYRLPLNLVLLQFCENWKPPGCKRLFTQSHKSLTFSHWWPTFWIIPLFGASGSFKTTWQSITVRFIIGKRYVPLTSSFLLWILFVKWNKGNCERDGGNGEAARHPRHRHS